MREINTPEVRQRISDLLHDRLRRLGLSEVGIRATVGALFVLLNQASTEAAASAPSTAGRCGVLLTLPVGGGSCCSLPFGHEGMHLDNDTRAEWGWSE